MLPYRPKRAQPHMTRTNGSVAARRPYLLRLSTNATPRGFGLPRALTNTHDADRSPSKPSFGRDRRRTVLNDSHCPGWSRREKFRDCNYAELGAGANRFTDVLTLPGAPLDWPGWCNVGASTTPCRSRKPLRPRHILFQQPLFAFFRAISGRGRAYSEAPDGKGRAPMPSTSAIDGQVRSLRATGNASQITHQRRRSLNLGTCRPPSRR